MEIGQTCHMVCHSQPLLCQLQLIAKAACLVKQANKKKVKTVQRSPNLLGFWERWNFGSQSYRRRHGSLGCFLILFFSTGNLFLDMNNDMYWCNFSRFSACIQLFGGESSMAAAS
ncbi:hypothetical protein BRADI_3g55565v3 [Brachypodium distachyon]|uniref:Uncharacterized protein n=1 Tax=Brachypodium distachyon TaxID=15368 RepID=A0A2K2D589_BRADI|nr:hypothetical protein BRADI_3g55565v3 [Brachypodium distachyon]